MVEPNNTLNQRREDRDNPIAQNPMDLWKPALKFQADMILLWARGVQLMAQMVTNAVEKIRQS